MIGVKCPCGSGLVYNDCCKPFHDGQNPPSPPLLVRSRFAAFALCLPDFIIRTTHHKHAEFRQDTLTWTKEILNFCESTQLEKLEILSADVKESEGTVSFVVYFSQAGRKYKLLEKSFFLKEGDKWLYRDGNYTVLNNS